MAAFAQSQKFHRIDYKILLSADAGDGEGIDASADDIILQGWTNPNYIKIQSDGEMETIIIHNRKNRQTYFLYPEHEQYVDANPENTASATTDEYPIKYIAGQQKNIAGYACKLAQLNLRHDTPEEDPIIVDIWYTEKIPVLYWGDFDYLEKLPGAALSISSSGNGFIAANVIAENVELSQFEVPENYTEVDNVEDYEDLYADTQLEENLFQYTDEETSLIGLKDGEDNLLTEAIYTTVAEFHAGQGVASNGDYKYGVIDRQGKVVIPFEYEYLSFNPDAAQYVFSKDEKFGIMDANRKVLIAPKYDMINFFNKGFAQFTENEKNGLLNLKGEAAVPANYETIIDYNGTHFITIENERYHMYTIQGLRKVATNLDYIGCTEEPNIFIAMKGDKYGYIDHTGKLIIPFKYSGATLFSDGVASVYIEETDENFWINTKGERVAAPTE
ncbi:WG repeat-containing protein [Sphingobacterium psychroaquaticum]|nr:WG repeat-containing protein [Sphingobacterium psychroaquaticum]